MEDTIVMRIANKKKCYCYRCVIWFVNGCDNWKCKAFLEGKPREILYENKPCPKFKPFVKRTKLNKFKQLLIEKYGKDFEIYSIAEYKDKFFASLTPKNTEQQSIYEYDAPAYILEDNEIKEVYGIEDSVIPFIKGKIVFKNPKLYEEDVEDYEEIEEK